MPPEPDRSTLKTDAEADEFRRVWYENSHADIRWSKEQAWKALDGTVILLAAIAAASVSLKWVPFCVFAGMILLAAGLAVIYLLDLHYSAVKSRKWCHDIIRDVKFDRPLPERRFDPEHVLYLAVRIMIVIGAGVLTALIAYGRTT